MKMSLSKTLGCFMLVSVVIFVGTVFTVYRLYSRSVHTQGRVFLNQTLEETAGRMEEVLNDVAGDLKQLAAEQVFMQFESMSATQRYQIKGSVKAILDSFVHFKQSVISLKLHGPGHSAMYSSSNFSPISDAALIMAYQQIIGDYELDKPGGDVLFTKTYLYDGVSLFGIAVPIYSSRVFLNESTYSGCLLAICSYAQITGVLPVDAAPCFISDGQTLLMKNDALRAGRLEEALQAGRDEEVFERAIPLTDLTVYALYSDATAEKQTEWLRWGCIGVTLLLMAVQSVLLLCLRMRITKPIQDIARQTRHISSGMLRVQNPDASRNELDILTSSINDMVLRVEQLGREAADAENKYLKERIMFLQTQMNPHFLFNNLECIRGMAALGRWESVVGIVGSMAKIYRYCVDNRNCVQLMEEMNCLQEYMHIMTLRYDGAFELKTEVAPEAERLLMPKMTLQPLAENAIQHGFLHAHRRQGILQVKAWAEAGTLMLVLSDNGAGMPQELRERLNRGENLVDPLSHRHIGIANIQSRIAIICSGDSSISFAAGEGGGLDVTLRLTAP